MGVGETQPAPAGDPHEAPKAPPSQSSLGLKPTESRNHPPPEAGFAGREAHTRHDRSDSLSLRRLLKRKHLAHARKEGAHGGTRGFPVKPSASEGARA
jgi:hypothetical protein